jgi:hypothetical protein
MLALLGGWKAYALAAILLVIGGLSVAVWGYRHKAAAAEARLDEIVGQRDRAIAAAKANEEAAKRLIQLNEALNAAIVERDKRAKALEEARRKIKGELDELKATLSAEDQDCLSRSLPDPLAHLLRGGPGDRDPDRASASAGSPASPVPHLEPQ